MLQHALSSYAFRRTAAIQIAVYLSVLHRTQKPPLVRGKRSAVAVVNDSPVDCQSRDGVARRQLAKIFDF